MLKKIALVGVFAIASLVSVSSMAVNSAQSPARAPAVGSPTMQGLNCAFYGRYCDRSQ